MPTGYTARIIDGKISNFQQFAKLCMRNFGATIHMRDESLDAEYTPRTPGTYYQDQIDKFNLELSIIKNMTAEEIISKKVKSLTESQEYHLNAINIANENRKILSALLEDARNFSPPTENHHGIKAFMIEQLESTIDFDCKTEYHEEKLREIKSQLENLDSETTIKELSEAAEKSLAYHKQSLKEEEDRCKESNDWVSEFLKAINP